MNKSRPPHMVRGVVLCLVLGIPLVMSVFVAVAAMVNQFFNGVIPSRWFSTNAVDWMFGDGTKGGAANYLAVMMGSLVAGGCATAIRWGFYGK
jgi:hypothetical protein